TTRKGVASHHTLPHRRARRTSRSVLRLRTYCHLVQLVPKPALPQVPGQCPPALAPGTETGTAAHPLCPRRLHTSAGTRCPRIAEQATNLQPAVSRQRRNPAGDRP